MRRELAAVVYVSQLAYVEICKSLRINTYKLSMENVRMEWNSCEIRVELLTSTIMSEKSVSPVKQITSCLFCCRRQMYLGSRDHAR